MICFVIVSCRSPGFVIEAPFERPAYLRIHIASSQGHATVAVSCSFFIAAFGNEATGDADTALNSVCNRGEITLSYKPFQWIKYLSQESLVFSPDMIMHFPSALVHSRVTDTLYSIAYIISTPKVFIHNQQYKYLCCFMIELKKL